MTQIDEEKDAMWKRIDKKMKVKLYGFTPITSSRFAFGVTSA